MENLERLKLRTNESDEELLQELLESAKHAILARRFPYGEYPETLEPRYSDLQVRIALAAYNKLGADYQTSHKENGVDRGWASEGIPEELLQEGTPVGGMVR